VTFQPPSNYLPTPLPPPKMAEMRKLEVSTRNTLGFCGKWGFQLPFQLLPTTVPLSPHTPLEGFTPLRGLWPLRGLTLLALFLFQNRRSET
jgi:hypothetical protein